MKLTNKIAVLIATCDVCSSVIVEQDIRVGIALSGHVCGSYLAKAYSMSPSSTLQAETSWAVSIVSFVFRCNYKCSTKQVGFRERTAYLEFFSDDLCSLRSNDAKTLDATTSPSFYWL